MDAEKAIRILQSVGLHELAGTEGCLCCSCEIQGVYINISCRKSSHSAIGEDGYRIPMLRVYSSHLDSTLNDLKLVADEIISQVKPDAENIAVRFCDYDYDKNNKCLYCGEQRTLTENYYCEKHAHMLDIA